MRTKLRVRLGPWFSFCTDFCLLLKIIKREVVRKKNEIEIEQANCSLKNGFSFKLTEPKSSPSPTSIKFIISSCQRKLKATTISFLPFQKCSACPGFPDYCRLFWPLYRQSFQAAGVEHLNPQSGHDLILQIFEVDGSADWLGLDLPGPTGWRPLSRISRD